MRGNALSDRLSRKRREVTSSLSELERDVRTAERREKDAEATAAAILADVALSEVRDDSGPLPTEIRRRLSARLDGIQRRRSELDTARGRIPAAHTEATKAREDEERVVSTTNERIAQLRRRIHEDPRYVAAASRVADLQEATRSIEDRLDHAERDVAEKRVPYDGDPLFSYLRRRGYGTRSYRSVWPFTRLDAILARYIGYDEASLGYDRLLRIPVWVETRSQETHAALDAARIELEAAAGLNGDEIERLTREADEARERARVATERRNDLASRITTLVDEIALADRNEDRALAEIVEVRAAMLMADASEARIVARRAIRGMSSGRRLRELEAALTAREEARRTISGSSDRIEEARRQAKELERAERMMSNKGWSTSRSRFDALPNRTLDGFIAGTIAYDTFARSAESAHQMERAGSSSGSSSDWSSGGGFGSSSSGSSSGWSTGGGFGGDSSSSSSSSDSGSSSSDSGGGF